MHPGTGQPPAGARGLLPARPGEPGIARQWLFLAVLHEVGQRHAIHRAFVVARMRVAAVRATVG